MTSLLTSLHLLSFKETEALHSSSVDCLKISNKSVCTQGSYPEAKNEFFQSRSGKCKLHKSSKKTAKTINELFKSYRCVFASWEHNQPLLLFFSNGSIVSVDVNSEADALRKIEIDDYICGKLVASPVVDAAFCSKFIFITYNEPKLTVINIHQDSPSLSSKLFGRKGSLLGFEPKVSQLDLVGPTCKNIERKLSINSTKTQLLVWWRNTGDDVEPWAPISYAVDRLCMLVYTLGESVQLLNVVQLQGELIHAKYSAQCPDQIFTIEEIKGTTNLCVYQTVGDQCHLVFISKLPLQGKVLSYDWSDNDKLSIVDSNSVLLVYDIEKRCSLFIKLLFTPKHIVWHPDNYMLLLSTQNGQVQCFDLALNHTRFKIIYNANKEYNVLELRSHILYNFAVHKVLWRKSDLNNVCLFILDCDTSALALLKLSLCTIAKSNLTALSLISQYMKSGSINEAILMLKSLNFPTDSEVYFHCLSKIANFLLRRPLNNETLSGLEIALGTFYNHVDNYPRQLLKVYGPKVHSLARRFFHLLLRHHQFKKAYMLALDLESQDLFLDLYHVATEKGEHGLALVARHKADELDDPQDNSSYTSDNSTETSVERHHKEDYGGDDYQSQGTTATRQFWHRAEKSPFVDPWTNALEMYDEGLTSKLDKTSTYTAGISDFSLSQKIDHNENFKYADKKVPMALPKQVPHFISNDSSPPVGYISKHFSNSSSRPTGYSGQPCSKDSSPPVGYLNQHLPNVEINFNRKSQLPLHNRCVDDERSVENTYQPCSKDSSPPVGYLNQHLPNVEINFNRKSQLHLHNRRVDDERSVKNTYQAKPYPSTHTKQSASTSSDVPIMQNYNKIRTPLNSESIQFNNGQLKYKTLRSEPMSLRSSDGFRGTVYFPQSIFPVSEKGAAQNILSGDASEVDKAQITLEHLGIV